MSIAQVETASPLWGVRGLYAICDADACERAGLKVLDCALAMRDSGIALLQIRAKGRPAHAVWEWVDGMVRTQASAGPRLLVNDRADIAALGRADGVHVGQDDLPVGAMRSVFPDLLVGLSTHGLEQFRSGLAARPDYLALGPIFATRSKLDPDPQVGLPVLSRCGALAFAQKIPLVAIGGLDEATLVLVATQCDLVAAISALLPAPGSNTPYTFLRTTCERFHAAVRSVERCQAPPAVAVH